MSTTFSHNETFLKRLFAFMLPLKIEVLLYLFLSLVFLSLVNYRFIAELVTSDSGIGSLDNLPLSDNMTIVIYKTSQGIGSISIFLFWLMIGSILYSIVWFLKTFATNVHEDIVEGKSVAPQNFKKTHWQKAFSSYIAFVAIIIGTVGYCYFLLVKIIPVLSKRALDWAYYKDNITSYVWLIVSVLGMAVSIYILKQLLRIAGYAISTFGME